MKIAFRLPATLVCAALIGFRASAAPGDVETGFDPNANGSVYSLSIQPDGKIVIGGDFTTVGGTNRNYLAQLNADGSLVASFNALVGNSVFCAAVQADGRIFIGGAFTNVAGTALNRVAWLNTNGTLNFSYFSDADNSVFSSSMQADGKIVLGGLFATIIGSGRNRIARLNASSSLDFGFNPNAGGPVLSTAVQVDGKILVGGSFGSMSGFPRIHLARINADNSLDLTFNANLSGSGVYSLALQADGKILIGGNFSSVGGVTRGSIARLNTDGTLDTNFVADADSDVYSLAVQADGRIVIGGNFTTVNGTTRNYIARLNSDGTLDTDFNPDANSAVKGLAIQGDGKIVIAGNFTSVGGTTRVGIARLLNDAAPATLSISQPNRIEWLRGGSSPETLQVTFEKSMDGGNVWTTLGAGTRIAGGWELTGLSVLGNGQIRARARTTGGQYNGSSSLMEATVAFSFPAPEIAIKGSSITITNGDVTPSVADHTEFGSALTNGGTVVRTFTIENTGPATLNLSGTPRVQVGGAHAADFVVTQLPPTTVFTGNGITFQVTFDPSAAGLRAATVSVVNDDPDESPYTFAIQGTGAGLGEADAGFNFGVTNTNRRINAVAVQTDGKIVFGGTFTNVGGMGRQRIARLNADGTLDNSFIATVGSALPAIANSVRSILLQTDGRMIIGGQFPNVDGHSQLAQLNSDGTVEPHFSPNPNGTVNCLTLQADGKIIVGGTFSQMAGVTRFRLARINADGTLDAAFDANVDSDFSSGVFCAAVQADGKIVVGGVFATVGGVTRNGIARVNPDGTLDTGFNPDANSYVICSVIQPDGKILIGGNFTNISGVARSKIARLNSDGTLDTGFNPNVNVSVYSMALQADGKIVIAGEFSTVGGVGRNRIARLNADGTLDTSFNPNANNFVYAVALQPDGKVIMGGDFTAVGGLTHHRIARIVNEAATQSLTAPATNRIEWLRGGTAPEIFQPTFEVSADGGSTWTQPAVAAPIAGGWELTGLSLPASGHIRARAWTSGGDHNGSVSLVETIANFPVGPDIAVEQPLNAGIPDGGTRDFGHLAVGAVTNITFTIRNTGQLDLTGLGITVDGPDAAMFTIVASPTSPVPASGGTTFTVRFIPTSDGAKLATLHIASNDSDENPFDIVLTGTGPGPEIAVKGNGANIDDGSMTPSITNHTEFGSALVNGGAMTRTFTIENSGALALNLTGTPRVQVGGAHAADFSVTLQPATPVSIGSNTTFQVTFDPSATGLRTATLSIACDDANENPYNFAIQGTGSLPGEVDTGFDPNADRAVFSPALQPDGKIVVGGAFINMGGVARNNLARLNADGTLETAFNPDPIGDVTSVAVKTDGKIMIGGAFTTVSGQSRTRLARINAVGTLDTGFNPTLTVNNTIYSMAMQADGNFVIGGGFSLVGGIGRNGIARVSGNGILDAFNPNPNSFAAVFTVAQQGSGKFIMGGSFNTVSGSTRNCIARLNADGTLDTLFNPNANGIVYGVAEQADGRIVIAGDFTLIGGVAHSKIARLNADGTLDGTFNPTVNMTVHTVALQADGKILIGGRFTTVNTVTRNFFARLNPDGTLDETFDLNLNNYVVGLTLQSDGKIILAGDFTMAGGLYRNHIARVENDLATQSLVVPDRSRVQWLRGGSSPETHQVAFELSVDGGSIWTPLGAGVRISGGWELTGLSLPVSGQVRARARVNGGQYNGSSGLVETVTAFSFPEIAVEQPVSVNIADGGSKSFGSLLTGSDTNLSFVIKNTGAADLTNLNVTIDGADAGLFTVTTAPTAPISGPNGSTTLTVRFAPVSTGVKTATLHIANNDPDESPFDITVTGTSLSAQEYWRLTYFGSPDNSGAGADLNDFDGDGIINVIEFGFGLDPTQNSAGQLPQPQLIDNNLVVSFAEPAGVSGVSYGADWTILLEPASWNPVSDTGIPPQHTFSVPVGTNTTLFLRLKMTGP